MHRLAAFAITSADLSAPAEMAAGVHNALVYAHGRVDVDVEERTWVGDLG